MLGLGEECCVGELCFMNWMRGRTGCRLVHWFYRMFVNTLTQMAPSTKLRLFPLFCLIIFFGPTDVVSMSSNKSFKSGAHASSIISCITSLRLLAAAFFEFLPKGIRSCAFVNSANSTTKGHYLT